MATDGKAPEIASDVDQSGTTTAPMARASDLPCVHRGALSARRLRGCIRDSGPNAQVPSVVVSDSRCPHHPEVARPHQAAAAAHFPAILTRAGPSRAAAPLHRSEALYVMEGISDARRPMGLARLGHPRASRTAADRTHNRNLLPLTSLRRHVAGRPADHGLASIR
jgi:hypothetical protein